MDETEQIGVIFEDIMLIRTAQVVENSTKR